VFTNTQAKVKSMGKTLELMGELQSDDMQKRHWEELSNETKHDIKPEDPNFKFYDLFKLNLIHYTEKVSDIVEIANHQTKIKKSLDKIKKQWDEKSFDWEEITEKETYSLQKTEEVIELVDQDLANLLNMLGQKKSPTSRTSRTRSPPTSAQSTNTCPNSTSYRRTGTNSSRFSRSPRTSSRTWLNTSRKFEDMNAGFKNLISEMRDQPTCKEACVVEGRVDRLKELLTTLDSCETELTVYLDQMN
jgi:hypothetical protein